MLPLFAQELSTSCVAACVRMALAALGFSLTESEIRSRCGHSGLGMRLNQVATGLADLPVEVEYHTDWNTDDLNEALRRSIFPIVGIDLRHVEGLFAFHAVIVANVTGEQMIVHDPLNAQSPRNISLRAFDEAWESADRECITIEMKKRV